MHSPTLSFDRPSGPHTELEVILACNATFDLERTTIYVDTVEQSLDIGEIVDCCDHMDNFYVEEILDWKVWHLSPPKDV